MARIRLTKPKPTVAVTWAVEIVLPIPTKSTANLREHHHAKARRVKMERSTTSDWLRIVHGHPLLATTGWWFDITLTRLGGRGLDDDNLANAGKAVRDGVADWLGIDDGDKRLTWTYTQEPGGPIGVRIRIEGVA